MTRDLVQLDRDLEAECAREHLEGADLALGRIEQRRTGAFFTPLPLVEFVVDHTLRELLRSRPLRWRGGVPDLRLLDPACGDGRFLAVAARRLAALAPRRWRAAPETRQAILQHCLVGFERSHHFAELARAKLGAPSSIHCCESLLDGDSERHVDGVIGNPPYQRSVGLSRDDPELWKALKQHFFSTSHGEWDLSSVFLERSLRWVAPQGVVGLVVPSRWLTSASASPLRALLAERHAVRGIVHFGTRQLFPAATVYASLVFLSAQPTPSLSVARWHSGQWRRGSVSWPELGASPWRIAVGQRRQQVSRIARDGAPLGSVARIAKGAGTSCDAAYLFADHRPSSRGSFLVRSRCLDGSTWELEPEWLAPCLRGRDVVPLQRAQEPTPLCLWPYDVTGQLVSPERLRAHQPLTWAYLEAVRERLDLREKGRFAGENFYRFGRPQNLAFLAETIPKIVIPDLVRQARAELDTRGVRVLDSAYAVRVNPGVNERLVLCVLNSPIVAWWLRETGISVRGDYVRMKTAYLRTLPLPPAGSALDDLAEVLARTADLRTLDLDLVHATLRAAYQLSKREWDVAPARQIGRAP